MRGYAATFTLGLFVGAGAMYYVYGGIPAATAPASGPEHAASESASNQESEDMHAQLARAELERDVARQALVAAQQELGELREERVMPQEHVQGLETALEKAVADLAQLSDAYTTLESSFVEVRDEADALREQVAELTGVPVEPAPDVTTVLRPVDEEPTFVPEAAVGNTFRGEGEFTLHNGDRWLTPGGAAFTVLRISAPASINQTSSLPSASVNAFGKQGHMEQGGQITRTTPEGETYSLIVTRIIPRTGTLYLRVEREG